MIHSFHTPTDGIALPKAFTFPFHYTPHPLTRLAADEVRQYLLTRNDWQEELHQGKMFGVLVIKDTEGKLGYLAAFSGNLAGSNHHAFFVPPVYDLLQPDGFSVLRKRRFPASTTGLPLWKPAKHTARLGRNGRRRKKRHKPCWLLKTEAERGENPP